MKMTANIEKLKGFPLENGEITGVEWIEKVEAPIPNPLKIQVEDSGSYYRVTMRPVSYTHLDVYKRQLAYFGCIGRLLIISRSVCVSRILFSNTGST